MYKQQRAESPMVSLAQGNTLRKSAFCLSFLLKIIFFRLNSDDPMIRDDTHLQFLQLTVLQFSENKSLGVIDQSLWHILCFY